MDLRDKISQSGGTPLLQWFEKASWKPFDFQMQAWLEFLDHKEGIVNAPTGSGKTYSLIGAIILEALHADRPSPKGLKMIWITPIRALAKEIQQSATKMLEGIGLDWEVGIRTGDTEIKEREKQVKNLPDILITTPESLHLLLARKGYAAFFKNLTAFVADEWHELMGSKRGVQVELALSRLRTLSPHLKTWGISATIGNMNEAMEVLLGPERAKAGVMVKSKIQKEITIETIMPDLIENYPWAGHLGIRLLDKVIPVIKASKTTLIFTNTRSQSEI